MSKRVGFSLLAMILAIGCSNDPPGGGNTTTTDSVTIDQDNALNISSAVCRPPLENNGVLHSEDGGDQVPLIYAYYYECSKNFPTPVCDQDFSPILGSHYTIARTQSSTAYSEGGVRIGYRCRGTIRQSPEMLCVEGLAGQVVSTKEFEQTYECSLTIAAPYCHADFRAILNYSFFAEYNWDGGWGPGNLGYQCVHLSNFGVPPAWPPI